MQQYKTSFGEFQKVIIRMSGSWITFKVASAFLAKDGRLK
jgi:hypothetical protein